MDDNRLRFPQRVTRGFVSDQVWLARPHEELAPRLFQTLATMGYAAVDHPRLLQSLCSDPSRWPTTDQWEQIIWLPLPRTLQPRVAEYLWLGWITSHEAYRIVRVCCGQSPRFFHGDPICPWADPLHDWTTVDKVLARPGLEDPRLPSRLPLTAYAAHSEDCRAAVGRCPFVPDDLKCRIALRVDSAVYAGGPDS